MAASDHPIGGRHEVEASAIEHLWPHSNDLEWDEYTERGLRVFVCGQGSTLTDVQGRSYLDGLAGLFLVNVGHGRDEIAAAMAEQAGRLAYTASSNSTNPATVALAETVASITPGDLDRVFFCSGGSEAVETALKIAKQAQVLRGYPKRYKVICRRGSYHGQTFGAMSLTSSAQERYFGPFMAGVSEGSLAQPLPQRLRAGGGGGRPDVRTVCRAGDTRPGTGACRRRHRRADLGRQRHAPSFARLLAGTAPHLRPARSVPDHGRGHYRLRSYWRHVRSRALWRDPRHHDHGQGPLKRLCPYRCGGRAPRGVRALHQARQRHQPLADLWRPCCGCGCGEQEHRDHPARESRGTLGKMGRYLLELADGLRQHPTVGDVRGGKGLLCAIDLVRSKETKQAWGTEHPFIKGLALRTQELGLITRVWDVLHLAPPLVITEPELERAIEIVDSCLTEMEREFADAIS